ncbi:MAG TPA: hydrogenase formation protein HypD [Anaerolineaceae bacterium]|nr:hydrogenase formation protein HypD [Anaerolineaceae bacterium]
MSLAATEGFRSAGLTRQLAGEIRRLVTRPWNIMEICGGQTHAILQYGLDQLLPPEITLIHGPGCPVCVTSLDAIENALQIARQPEVVFTSFGDMLRVPGAHANLFSARAEGADVRVVYSPLDAVKLAQENPQKQVVFFAIGFETTVPSIAASILHAERNRINNFSILPANVLVPPAMHAILKSPDNRVNAFLAAGHVCAVMGYWEYEPIAAQYRTPIAVTGFEPVDLMRGILMCVRQLESARFEVENAYSRAVTRAGNRAAQDMISQVFEPVDRQWRGIGVIPLSGLGLRPDYSDFNALKRFRLVQQAVSESPLCIAGQVLRGNARPPDCPAFRKECTPASPLGAPMVSSEGACAAYYRYQRVSA